MTDDATLERREVRKRQRHVAEFDGASGGEILQALDEPLPLAAVLGRPLGERCVERRQRGGGAGMRATICSTFAWLASIAIQPNSVGNAQSWRDSSCDMFGL